MPFLPRVRTGSSKQTSPFLNKAVSFLALAQRRGNAGRSQAPGDPTPRPTCRWARCWASARASEGTRFQRVLWCCLVLRRRNSSKHQNNPQPLRSPFQRKKLRSGWARARTSDVLCSSVAHRITVTAAPLYLHVPASYTTKFFLACKNSQLVSPAMFLHNHVNKNQSKRKWLFFFLGGGNWGREINKIK